MQWKAQQSLNQLPRQAAADGQQDVAVGDMLFRVPAGETPQSTLSGNIWTNGAVYYVFDDAVSATNRTAWRQAAAEWSSSGAVTFIEGMGSGNYVVVKDSTVNNSHLGMIGGAQTMNIVSWDQKFIIAHEIGHALGLVHEHSRSDRDTYVSILSQNITAGMERDFGLFNTMTYGAYDFASVMHYPRNAWSSNGQNTIEPKTAYRTYLYTIGYPTRLSSLDRSGLLQRYGVSAINPPSVQTIAATAITANSAVISGKVMSDNGSAIDDHFFYWGPAEARYELDESHITVSGDSFSATVTGLTPNTTYYFIAYSHNSSTMDLGPGPGWGAGEVISFITPAANPNTTVTLVANPSAAGSVTGGGSFPAGTTQSISATANAGWRFTSWNDGVTQNPRTIVVPSTGVVYTANFVQNSAVVPPTIATVAATAVKSTSAVMSGRINSDGGARVGFRTFRWGTSDQLGQTVGISDVLVVGDSFAASISGLTANTTYYYQAVASNGSSATVGTNPPGWGSGVTVSFRTPAVDAATAQPLNISTRLTVGTGDNAIIAGFIVAGDVPKRLMLRAIGPSLSSSGASNALQDPRLELFDGNAALIAANNDWAETQHDEIAQSGLAPSDGREAALIQTLAPGSYTAVVRGVDDSTGTGLIEIYDLDADGGARLANISTRGLVQSGDDIMIAGFIIGGAQDSGTVVVRALGPSLSSMGVSGGLADPVLELRDENGELVDGNDDWQTGDQAASVQLAGLQPNQAKESATVVVARPGAYTAIVRGANGASGIAIVEVYNLR